jgi:hypothetical protein
MTATRKPWTPEQIDALRRLYPDYSADVVGRVIGRAMGSVHSKANALGIAKSEAFQASDYSGRVQRGKQRPAMRATQFKPWQVPWNKGISTHAGGRSTDTQFKPGRPASEARNYLPIGSLRLCKDGHLTRKVTDDPSMFPALRWVAVHRLVWVAEHGPLPPGHIVAFKPGMKTARLELITTERLECISQAENLSRNRPINHSPEWAKLVQLKGAITRQVNRINREAQEAQHP